MTVDVLAHRERRAQPGAKIEHALHELVVQAGSMLDRVHARVERLLRAVARVRVGRHAFPQGVRFIDDDAGLVQGVIAPLAFVADRKNPAAGANLDPIHPVAGIRAHQSAALVGPIGGRERTALDRRRCEQVAVPAGHPHEAGDEHACAVQQLLVGGVFDGDLDPTSGGVAQRGKAGLSGAAGIGRGVKHLLLQKRRLAPQVEIGAILAGVRADVDVSVDQPWQKRLAADVVDARTVRNADARARSDGQDLAPAEQHAAIFERRRAVAIDQRASDQGDVLRHGSSRCYSVFAQ